jgi:hypothetical protein
MPNVTVACPHVDASWNKNPKLPEMLLAWAKDAIDRMNDEGQFDRPLLWYYSPMDSAWSLGHIPNRGVVYDCMDELSQFTGAPRSSSTTRRASCATPTSSSPAATTSARRRRAARQRAHLRVRRRVRHFGKAQLDDTVIPPDIDFMPRPIIGGSASSTSASTTHGRRAGRGAARLELRDGRAR